MPKQKAPFQRDMPVIVRSQEPLRKAMDNDPAVEINAGTIAELLKELQRRYPRLPERLLDRNGGVLRFINIYVNEEDIRFLQNQETVLKDGDEVTIIPATSGG